VESILSVPIDNPANVDWVIPPSAILKTAGKLFVCSNMDLPSPIPSSVVGPTMAVGPASFLQICTPGELAHPHAHQTPDLGHSNHMWLEVPEGKRGRLQLLQIVLPQSMAFISSHLRKGSCVCISCDSGKDISVGVALAALQIYFDDSGNLIPEDAASTLGKCPDTSCQINLRTYEAADIADKQSIKTRLQWIISSRPAANPSRTTLKRVNEFLLTSVPFNRSILDTSSPDPVLP
jgi:tRNA A64-2'-O-ribosylphosphate transferase